MQWPVSVGNKLLVPFLFRFFFRVTRSSNYTQWALSGILARGNAACPQTVAVTLLRHQTHPICHTHTPRYNGEFNCAYYYRHLLTKPCRMHAIRRGHLSRHPESYCQRSHGMHDCLKARQPRGQIIKFMWWGEENDFKNTDLLLV